MLHTFENIARKRITWPDGWFFLPCCICMLTDPSWNLWCVPRGTAADELRRPSTEDPGKQVTPDQGQTDGVNSPIQHSIDHTDESLSPGPLFLCPRSHVFSSPRASILCPLKHEHLLETVLPVGLSLGNSKLSRSVDALTPITDNPSKT